MLLVPPKHKQQPRAAAHPRRLHCKVSCPWTPDKAALGEASALHTAIAAIASLKTHLQGPRSEKAQVENMQ